MISRSSSAYQPLAQAAASEVVTPAVPRRNYSGNATSVKIQGIVADNDDADEDDPMSHEVTTTNENFVMDPLVLLENPLVSQSFSIGNTKKLEECLVSPFQHLPDHANFEFSAIIP